MKIYRIRLDSNRYQRLLPADERVWETDTLVMDCTPKAATWVGPEVFIFNPKLKAGNFLHLCSGAFVADTSAVEDLQAMFEMSGEMLEIVHQSQKYYLVNILNCANCLDEKNTKWVIDKLTGTKVRIQNYSFLSSRFSEAPLFKIPETAAGEMLTYTGLKDPGDEFKTRVEQLGLTGLLFEEIWSA
jgi:hypothetical protein